MRNASKKDIESIQRLSLCRWKYSVKCPSCASTSISDLIIGRGLYQCRDCRKQFGVFKGTEWEGTRMNPSQWELYVRTLFRMIKAIVKENEFELHHRQGWRPKRTYLKRDQPDILIPGIPIRAFMSEVQTTSFSTARSFLKKISGLSNGILTLKNHKSTKAFFNKTDAEDTFITLSLVLGNKNQ